MGERQVGDPPAIGKAQRAVRGAESDGVVVRDIDGYVAQRRLARDGEAMIAGTKVDGRRYLKFTLLNPATTVEQMREIVDLILTYGMANDRSVQPMAAAPAANRAYRRHA